ncbi:type IV pilus twitching motility protein PilT [Demequina maris]|uniref:type IV pilus twitching motility protein PilT n=1 Tax=Demequina maris TaxID=1638982 RepID=UPI0027149670|nr:type IV pilus twitching motility protein PilT [Demequina maris]
MAPVAPTSPSLHQTPQQATRRAPFLEERRPYTGQPGTPAAGAPQAPAASSPMTPPAGAPVASSPVPPAGTPTAMQAPVPPTNAAAAFAAAAQSQGAFMPAPEPAPVKEEPKPAPAAPAQQTAAGPKAQPVGKRVGMTTERDAEDLDINVALRQMMKVGASDLHVTTGAPPMVRLDGELQPLEGFGKLTPEGLQRTLYSILTQKQRETFEEHLELDFSYAVVGEARFRVNLYMQRSSVGAAFRVIPYEIKPLEALGIPPAVAEFASKPRGLVLVTGPTGSGKSTTLASLIDLVNRQRADHIMTVEDPIEFLHKHKKSLVNQREVGADTLSFKNALKHVLRQDPDVILVGEMRDLETIQVALTAAETGHLVFATLHTQDTAQTIDRIIDVFPAEQQAQVRTQLGTAIQGVMCQALCKRSDGPGRAVAVEVMVATPAIRNLIREGKTHQIYSMLQAGSKQGMQTMDQHLAALVKQGRISYDTGAEMCHHLEDFNRLCGRGSLAGAEAH